METGPLAGAEAGQAVALWERCGLTRPWNDPHADLALARGAADAEVLAARLGGAVVATVMVGFDGHRGWVYYLAVEPEHRRCGLGRAMMDAAEAWLRARGAPKLQLMVRDTNADALGFYAALGFERQPVATLGKRLGQGPAVGRGQAAAVRGFTHGGAVHAAGD